MGFLKDDYGSMNQLFNDLKYRVLCNMAVVSIE